MKEGGLAGFKKEKGDGRVVRRESDEWVAGKTGGGGGVVHVGFTPLSSVMVAALMSGSLSRPKEVVYRILELGGTSEMI